MNGLRAWIAVFLAAFCLWNAVPASFGAEKTANKKQELRRIQRQMEEKKRTIRAAGRRERSVLADIERIDKAVQGRDAELAQEQRRLSESEAALREVERDQTAAESGLDTIKRAYRGRVRALYKMGRGGYAVGILTSSDMNAAVKRMKYLEIIADRDRRVIADYRAALDDLSRREAGIAAQTAEITRRRQDIRARQAELAAQRGKKSALLASVRREKDLSGQVLEELEESSRSLGALIREEEAKRKTETARERPATSAPAASLIGRGRLPWPVNGKVVTPYGRQRHPEFGTIVFRRGIEIEAREGEPVHAVSAGRVAYADWYKGYGKLLILEHAGGIYSLYGYLSQFGVKKGDDVAAGQVVALAGDTGSLKGARLYFEIRRHGDAEDPLAWLSPKRTALR